MRFKLILPEKQLESNRYPINIAFKKNRNLCLVFAYVYQTSPSSVTEVTNTIISHEKFRIDRTIVYRHLQTLSKLGLLTPHLVTEVIVSGNDNEINRKIKQKYHKLSFNLPLQVKKRLASMVYYEVNDYGEEFVPWVSDILGIKYEEIK